MYTRGVPNCLGERMPPTTCYLTAITSFLPPDSPSAMVACENDDDEDAAMNKGKG